jgi:hypothetical protein
MPDPIIKVITTKASPSEAKQSANVVSSKPKSINPQQQVVYHISEKPKKSYTYPAAPAQNIVAPYTYPSRYPYAYPYSYKKRVVRKRRDSFETLTWEQRANRKRIYSGFYSYYDSVS